VSETEQTPCFAFYSAGGYARENIRDLQLAQCQVSRQTSPSIYLIDDDEAMRGTLIHNVPVISYDDAKSIRGLKVNVAFADPNLRKLKQERCEADGLPTFSSQSPTSQIGPNCSIGSGFILSHLSTITCDAKIGKSFHCNIYSYVAHDCVVGDYVTLAPRVSVNGRVVIGDRVYIGTGAIILPGLKIGHGAVVGAGAVVLNDVPDSTTVVGMPAKPRAISAIKKAS
jgi:sugar O-acyltransferase (sialic acid O-acetyltransferase NeuD family)